MIKERETGITKREKEGKMVKIGGKKERNTKI